MRQAINSSDALANHLSQNVIMAIGTVDDLSDKELRASVAERVKWLLAVAESRGETKTAFAERMGMSYPNLKARLKSKSFSIHSLIRLAESLNVSLDFICGREDRLSAAAERPRTLVEMLAAEEEQPAESEQLPQRKVN